MTDQDPQSPRVAVLMATFQAGEDLMPQLQSLLEQSLKPARIVISDDGSTDGTRARLKSFAAQAGRDGIAVTVIDGPPPGRQRQFSAPAGPARSGRGRLRRPGRSGRHLAAGQAAPGG
ncbi:glycosyltransferase [Jhaorihella thermophila]